MERDHKERSLRPRSFFAGGMSLVSRCVPPSLRPGRPSQWLALRHVGVVSAGSLLLVCNLVQASASIPRLSSAISQQQAFEGTMVELAAIDLGQHTERDRMALALLATALSFRDVVPELEGVLTETTGAMSLTLSGQALSGRIVARSNGGEGLTLSLCVESGPDRTNRAAKIRDLLVRIVESRSASEGVFAECFHRLGHPQSTRELTVSYARLCGKPLFASRKSEVAEALGNPDETLRWSDGRVTWIYTSQERDERTVVVFGKTGLVEAVGQR